MKIELELPAYFIFNVLLPILFGWTTKPSRKYTIPSTEVGKLKLSTQLSRSNSVFINSMLLNNYKSRWLNVSGNETIAKLLLQKCSATELLL